MPYRTPQGARLLKIMFGMLLIMSAILFYFVFLTFTGNLRPSANIDVIKNGSLTVPDKIKIGEQFKYTVEGDKLVNTNGVTRRQIECTGNNVNLIEVIDTIEPRSSVGHFKFNRVMTIPTYKQNLKANPKCRFMFITTYNFYYSTATQENSRVIPIAETLVSNEFELIDDDEGETNQVPADGISSIGNVPRSEVGNETAARDPVVLNPPLRNDAAAQPSGGSSSSGGSTGEANEEDPNFLESLIDPVQNGISDTVNWIVR